jgi:hypothetical protein
VQHEPDSRRQGRPAAMTLCLFRPLKRRGQESPETHQIFVRIAKRFDLFLSGLFLKTLFT